jgi:dihydroorotase
MKNNLRSPSSLLRACSVLLCLLLAGGLTLRAQNYDLLIKNGHVIDPKNGINELMDVAVKDGNIARVAKNIPPKSAKKIVDATGLHVVPGLIDIHAHVFFGTEEDAYLSNSYTALPPDGFTFRAGVTTVVDCGDAGWRNFDQFREQTVNHSKTRVLALINIVGAGMKGGHLEQNPLDMDPKMTAEVIKANRDVIVGVKLAHYMGHEWGPAEKAAEAGRRGDVPVMIDFGGAEPHLGLDTLLLQVLRPGDIFTHCFAHVNGRTAIVDETTGKVRPFVWEAQKRGIVFDVGHGGGSFVWSQAVPAFKDGFEPNSISTDLHTGSMNGAMKDQLNIMSKLLNLGLSLEKAIDKSTWAPAQYIQRPELGHLSVGSEADIAVLRLHTGDFGFIDTQGYKLKGDKKLECELTLRNGQIVWDLNGISQPEWKEK